LHLFTHDFAYALSWPIRQCTAGEHALTPAFSEQQQIALRSACPLRLCGMMSRSGCSRALFNAAIWRLPKKSPSPASQSGAGDGGNDEVVLPCCLEFASICLSLPHGATRHERAQRASGLTAPLWLESDMAPLHSPFLLPPDRVYPFDLVYDGVTIGIRAQLADSQAPLTSNGRAWLARLIESFQAERALWNDRAELSSYRARWLLLRTRALKLAAGAYLHISYDLPRAMADDWPGSPVCHNLSEAEGEAIYESLGPLFTECFHASARRYAIVGIGWPIGYLPRGMGGFLVDWILLLREGAWRHARKLAAQPAIRPLREAAMAKAMTAALEDVSRYFAWDASLLRPPVFAAPLAATSLTLLAVLMPMLLVLALVAYIAYRLGRERAWRRLQEGQFLALFAALLHDYMEAAVNEPESFDQYLDARRQDGLDFLF